MLRRPFVAGTLVGLILFLFLSSSLPAAPVKVSLGGAQTREALPSEEARGHLVALSGGNASGGAAERSTQTFPWQGERQFTVDLAPGVAWRLTLEVEGFWSPPAVVVPGDGETVAKIWLWPTGMVEGTVLPPRGVGMPEALNLRFQTATQDEGPHRAEIPETQIPCPVDEDGHWECAVPADRLDVRLRVPTFVSRFHWDVQIPTDKPLKLEPFALERGASLVGWVEVEEGQLDPARCRVNVLPMAAGQITNQSLERLQRVSQSIRVGKGGFFHLAGIPAGSYRVLVQQPGFAPTTLFPVTVLLDAETEIREPLVLRKPLDFSVRLTPTLDAMNEPWKVVLWRLSDIPGGAEQVAAGKAYDGFFSTQGLTVGRYLVRMQDSQGSQLKAEEVNLTSSEVLEVELPLIWVEGELTLGDEPLQAEVWFGGPFGAQRIMIPSDDEGHFSGFLPREGKWKVFVTAESPPVAQYFYDVEVVRRSGDRAAKVELELPDTKVHGVVVMPDGTPAPDALVRLYDAESSRDTVASTDEDGEFRFLGLAEGPARLVAEKLQAISNQVEVNVSEDFDAPSVRLTLREHRSVVGQVLGPDGQVLPGVLISARGYLNGMPVMAPIGEVTTDVEGTFQLRVPAEATHLQVTAFPPGYALTVLRLAPVSREPITIRPEKVFGTLVLELPKAIDWNDEQSERPALFLGGVIFPIQQLLHWATINGIQGQAGATEIRIPALPPGQHLACEARVLAVTNRLQPQPDGSCTEVQVVPFAEERVELGNG